MAISFNEVPADILVPGTYTEIDNSQATSNGAGVEQNILIVGVENTTGSTGPTEQVVQMFGDQDGQQWGEGGLIDRMVQASKRNDGLSATYVIALPEDGSGVAAVYDLTFAGTATADGVLYLYPAGQRVPVAIASGDTANDQATKAKAALDAAGVAEQQPWATGTVAGAVLPLTVKWKGASGNGLTCPVNLGDREALPSGVTAPVLSVDTAGAVDPDVALAVAAMTGQRFTHVALPLTETANLNAMRDELETRFGPLDQQSGVSFSVIKDSAANLITLIGDGARNSQVQVIEGHDGSSTPVYEWTAALTAKACTETDPARPFQTLELEGIRAPETGDRFALATRDQLLRNGVATTVVSDDGRVRIERLVTTYQKNALGAADTSFRNLNTVLSAIYFRDAVNQMARLKFPRFKLANDGTRFGPGQKVVTPSIFAAEIVALALDLELAAIMEEIDAFKETLLVERDSADPDRLNWQAFPNFVNQARVFAGVVTFKV